MDDFLNDFIEETTDIISKINAMLTDLRSRPVTIEDMNALFRWVHTIKGGAGMMDFVNTKNVAHTLENDLADCKKDLTHFNHKKVQTAIDCIDELLSAHDSAEMTPQFNNKDCIENNASEIINDFQNAKYFSEFASSFSDYIELMLTQKSLCFELSLKAGEAEKLIEKLEKFKIDVIQKEFAIDNGTNEDHLLASFESSSFTKLKPIIDKLEKLPGFQWLLMLNNGANKKMPSNAFDSPPQTAQAEDVHSLAIIGDRLVHKTENVEVVRVPLERVNDSLNSVWEIFLLKNQLSYLLEQNKAYLRNHGDLWQEIEKIDSSLSRNITEMESTIMSMRMSPINGLFLRMEKAVRQYLQTSNKEIEVAFTGADVEIDKKLLDILGEPLIHMIRNAMDHGIEDPVNRTKLGKNKKGLLKLKAISTSDKLIMELTDDGKGIDKDFITQKALAKGLISVAPTNEQEVYQLLFMPGFSTAEKVTEVSGRGVGMDVVKKTIDSLGGEIRITSQVGVGTSFHVELPLSMSLVSSVVVAVNRNQYAMAINNLLEVLSCDELAFSENRNDKIFLYREKYVSYFDLRQVYHPESPPMTNTGFMLVLQFNDVTVGFLVDKIIRHTDIVVKEMTPLFLKNEEVVGVSIQATGAPLFVLSPEKIFKKQAIRKDVKNAA